MLYDNYQYYGMHLGWWFIWGIMLFWIFATPYDIPGQRNTPLYTLKKRLASGQITNEEYHEKKKIIETGLRN